MPPNTLELNYATKELVDSYYKLYGMEVLGEVTEKDGIINACIFINGTKGQIKACTQANKYEVEDVAAARNVVTRLHKEFIKLLYRKVKEVIW